MALAPSPAWTLATDSYQIIRPSPPRNREDTDASPASLYRTFRIVGTAGTCLAGLALVVYPLAAFGYEVHRVVLTLLMVAMLVGAVVGTISFMTILAVRTVDRLHARRLAAARVELRADLAATASRYAQLVELPDGIRTQIDRQARTFTAMVSRILSGQAELGERVLALAGRVEAAEQARDRLAREHVALALAVHDQLQAIEAGAVQARQRTAAVEQDRERMAKEHTGFARLVLEELRGVSGGVAHLRERVEAVEQQVDDLAGKVDNATTAAGIIAAAECGSIRQLHPQNGSRRR